LRQTVVRKIGCIRQRIAVVSGIDEARLSDLAKIGEGSCIIRRHLGPGKDRKQDGRNQSQDAHNHQNLYERKAFLHSALSMRSAKPSADAFTTRSSLVIRASA